MYHLDLVSILTDQNMQLLSLLIKRKKGDTTNMSKYSPTSLQTPFSKYWKECHLMDYFNI